jgi:glycine hydroxymethyltransferase
MRQIADRIGAIFMVDMAHISGLVAGRAVASPFAYADVVTSTTHKTLRGPRSGMIFAKRPYMDRINAAVFPALQGGPHNHQIGALAVALKEAADPSFAQYAHQVIANAQALAAALQAKGHVLATGGTDNHLMLWNVRHLCLTGSKVEKVLELASMTVNKNAITGDTSALNPGGVRLGTPALTSRGLREEDFRQVATFLDRGAEIALSAQERAAAAKSDGKVLYKDFVATLTSDVETAAAIVKLREEVEQFATSFPMP